MVHLLTGEMQDIELFNGRLDAEKLDTMVTSSIHPELFDAIYICGPEFMTRNLIAKLQEYGIAEDRIKYELFTSAHPVVTKRPNAHNTKDENDKTKVTIIIDGASRSIYMIHKMIICWLLPQKRVLIGPIAVRMECVPPAVVVLRWQSRDAPEFFTRVMGARSRLFAIVSISSKVEICNA